MLNNYKVQLLGFGPFELPKHDKWLIVGSGPSLDEANFHWLDYGIISLNSLQKTLPKSHVSIFGHYEDVVNCWTTLENSNLIYIANPIHVGYRCLKQDTHNIFNYQDFMNYLPDKVRFFEKEESFDQFKQREHTLFCKHTIASAALSLLWRNGVKEVRTVGIDGGEGHAKVLHHIRDYCDEKMIMPTYDNAYAEFCETAKMLGITIMPLIKKETHNAMREAC